MDLTDPDDFIVYSTFFEDEIDEGINKNAGCCSTLIVLLVLAILVSIVIV